MMFGALVVFLALMAGLCYVNTVIFRVDSKIGTKNPTQKNGFCILKIWDHTFRLIKPVFLVVSCTQSLQTKLQKAVLEA